VSSYYNELGDVNGYCTDISKIAYCENFIEEVRELFGLDEDAYFSEDE
jgi:hypothetical protein